MAEIIDTAVSGGLMVRQITNGEKTAYSIRGFSQPAFPIPIPEMLTAMLLNATSAGWQKKASTLNLYRQ